MEEYRIIKDFPDYEVSNLGRVRNIKTGKILSPGVDRGYMIICLCKGGEKKMCKIHRLVAEAFLPNHNNYPEVNHKDENKLNNNVDNLEWCDRKYNINYGTRTEKCSKPVAQYDLNGNLVATWKSTMEIERVLGYFNSNISACCLGKYKTMYGYIWRYV